jgi:hypothetical protein
MKYLPDYFKDVVTAISTEANPVYSHFGNWSELLMDLEEKKKSPTYQSLRYPLVMLWSKYSERYGEISERAIADNVFMYIICQSSISGLLIEPQKYTTQQRWDSIFTVTINPIYEALLLRMKFGAVFVKTINDIPHNRTNDYNLWVGDKINKLPDNLDAIELNFKNLTYYLKK